MLVDLRIQLRAMHFVVDDCGRELVVGEGVLQRSSPSSCP